MELNSQPKPDQPGFEADIACDECGRFGAVQIGGRHLCPDCYQGKGSCCPEFDKDDLWIFQEPAGYNAAAETPDHESRRT